eukprot:Tamp_21112.p1 GENE.Tamp_21112~~Tamp_21112.p1  ORF type:complete len:359 (-),score=58.45 Tamp_21112:87-1034(-)
MSAAPASLVAGFESIADRYDGFILDQFGVMHNGVVALPGAQECFQKLAKAGKKLVILSNTSRRAANAQGKLPGMGFDTEALSGFVTSGEEAYLHIEAHHQGHKCLFFTWEREETEPDSSFLAGLDVGACSVADADFILCHGTEVISTGDGKAQRTNFLHSGDIAPYQAALEEAKRRDLEMLVANADFRAALPSGELGHMPGSIGKAYQEMGGRVRWFGKPHAQHFDACLRHMEPVHPSRVVHVGDSLDHDVAGANNAGVHSVFIGGGIHAAELGLQVSGDGILSQASQPLTQDKVDMVITKHGATPTWVCTQFKW